MQQGVKPGTVLETTDWQQKGRRSLEGSSSVPASLTAQTSHQLCQPSLEALQTCTYLELPVMSISKCTAAQRCKKPCSGKQNYLFHIKNVEKVWLSLMLVKKSSYTSDESVPYTTVSHFSSCEMVSLSGARQGNFQRQSMPPEHLRQPRETTAGDCNVTKKTEIPEICRDCNQCPSGLQMSQSS